MRHDGSTLSTNAHETDVMHGAGVLTACCIWYPFVPLHVSVQLLLAATDFSSSSDTATPLLPTKIPMDSQVHGSSIDDLFSAAANHSTGP